MLSFQLCSDEDIEAIFYLLNFPTNWRLRRCSRRWRRLLGSVSLLDIAVVPLTYLPTLMSSKTAAAVLRAVLPQAVHLVLIGRSTSTHYDFLNVITAGDTLAKLLDMPASGQLVRRLTLCQFDIPPRLLAALYERAGFDWIVLNNVSLTGELVQRTLISTFHVENQNTDPANDDDDPFLPLHHCNCNGIDGLTTELFGSHVMKRPLDVDTGDNTAGEAQVTAKSADAVLFGLITENMRHLSQQETTDMLDRLVWHADEDGDAEGVQTAFMWLLKVYEPNLDQSTDLSWRTFDYQHCSPLVGRVMACYDRAWHYYDDDRESEDGFGGDYCGCGNYHEYDYVYDLVN